MGIYAPAPKRQRNADLYSPVHDATDVKQETPSNNNKPSSMHHTQQQQQQQQHGLPASMYRSHPLIPSVRVPIQPRASYAIAESPLYAAPQSPHGSPRFTARAQQPRQYAPPPPQQQQQQPPPRQQQQQQRRQENREDSRPMSNNSEWGVFQDYF